MRSPHKPVVGGQLRLAVPDEKPPPAPSPSRSRNQRMALRLDAVVATQTALAAEHRRRGEHLQARAAEEHARSAGRAAAILRAGPSGVRRLLAS